MKAVIMAAGKGTRLRPLTLKTPKPLLTYKNKPVLAHVMQSLPSDIGELIVVVNYLGEQIKEWARKNISLKYKIIYQNNFGGTYNALLAAKDYLGDTRFMVMNADVICNREDLEECLKFDRAMLFARKQNPEEVVERVRVENNIIKSFEGKSIDAKNIYIGVAVLDKNIFEIKPVKLESGEFGLPHTIVSASDEYPVNFVLAKHAFKHVSRVGDLD